MHHVSRTLLMGTMEIVVKHLLHTESVVRRCHREYARSFFDDDNLRIFVDYLDKLRLEFSSGLTLRDFH